MAGQLTFREAAERVLASRGKPMHYREITQAAIDGALISTQGRTPDATLNAQLATDINERGDESRFYRIAPGVFALREWLGDSSLDLAGVYVAARPMVPHYPTYETVRDLLPVWNGAPVDAITRMRAALMEHRGTPQDQVDWTDPDEWIEERLDGEPKVWAKRTWEGTERRVSPRYVVGHWLLVRNYELLETGEDDHLHLSAAGADFADQARGATVRRIDREQGLLWILRLVAEAGGAAPAELLGDWFEFLNAETNVRADTAAKAHLSHRLRNLLNRDLVSRSGHVYSITPAGLQYLESSAETEAPEEPEADLSSEIRRLQEALRQQVRDSIKAELIAMDPYAFERLIQRLLDAMGYQDTQTTSRSGDGGVDVLGTIKVGITEIKEVVQAKRQQANVGRGVLDALRGSLYRFDAVQGTVITTSGFAKGASDVAFDRGAPPITLIDGDTLVSLLIEHGIGVEKRKIELWSFVPSAFIDEVDEVEE